MSQLVLRTPKFVSEKERKFGMPMTIDLEAMIHDVSDFVLESGWEIIKREVSNRQVRYMDKPDQYPVLRLQKTIREVIRYNKDGTIKSIRYDIKTGVKDERMEATLPSPDLLEPDVFAQYIPIDFYRNDDLDLYLPVTHFLPLSFVAQAKTRHRKMKMKKDSVILEMKFDEFDVLNGIDFRELEIEIKGDNGNKDGVSLLNGLYRSIAEEFTETYKLLPYDIQKYGIIMFSPVQTLNQS